MSEEECEVKKERNIMNFVFEQVFEICLILTTGTHLLAFMVSLEQEWSVINWDFVPIYTDVQ